MSEKTTPEKSSAKSAERKKRLRQKRITHKLQIFNIFIILLVFIGGFTYLLAFDRETVSNEENRTLTEFPEFTISSYLSGEYTAGIADYYDDTVHKRSDIKGFISSTLLPLKGRDYGEDEIVLIGQINKEENDEYEEENVTEAPTTEPSTEPSTEVDTNTSTAVSEQAATESSTTVSANTQDDQPVDNGEISDGIVIINNRGVMLFGGGKKNGREYGEALNAYKRDLGDSVNVYSMVCPTPVSYYLPEQYQDLTASETGNIDNINSVLDGVTPIDAYSALLKHKDEAIYCRTDHHWQPLGAYYAAEEFARVAGVPFAPLDEYETITLPGYVGTLYGYTKSDKLLNNPEEFIYYKPKTNTTVTKYDTAFKNPQSYPLLLDPANFSNSAYYMVFGGDSQITHIQTECDNDRTLVIFKDSYGNALVPVLTSSFENIYLCDVRYFDINAVSFIKEVGATDLLFAMCTYSATGVNHSYAEKNRTK